MGSLARADLIGDAIARTLFAPTTLRKAIERLGFVQADPIRAPARAQDLILRHRVKDYRAGDLDRAYPSLEVEEEYLVNYGFLPRAHVALMHPRTSRHVWTAKQRTLSAAILEFIGERGAVHPAEVEAEFAHGRVKNAWGGMSRASTALLDSMHYRGLLRIARRDQGIRVYALPLGARNRTDSCGAGFFNRRLPPERPRVSRPAGSRNEPPGAVPRRRKRSSEIRGSAKLTPLNEHPVPVVSRAVTCSPRKRTHALTPPHLHAGCPDARVGGFRPAIQAPPEKGR